MKKNIALDWVLAFSYHAISTVYFQIVATCFFYLILGFWDFTDYSDYKLVYDIIVFRSNIHITLTILIGFNFMEVLIISLTGAFLQHEKKLMLWSNDNWKMQINNILIKLVIVFNYAYNYADNYNLVYSIIMGLCFLSQMILGFLSPLYWKCFFFLFNMWFNSFVFLLEFMILIISLY